MKIIAGNSNVALADEVSKYIDVPLANVNIGKFADGEIRVEINDNMRGRDVFVMQSTSSPVNTNLMELLVMIDA